MTPEQLHRALVHSFPLGHIIAGDHTHLFKCK